jgi:hypothetical protein
MFRLLVTVIYKYVRGSYERGNYDLVYGLQAKELLVNEE